jgi:hypothetical protein
MHVCSDSFYLVLSSAYMMLLCYSFKSLSLDIQEFFGAIFQSKVIVIKINLKSATN